MAELNIHLDVRVTPNVVRWGLAALLMTAITGDLASESVQLQTYYPAPSGVYTNMVTTGQSWLARDGGFLAVGTPQTTPAVTAKFTVMNGNVGIGTIAPAQLLEVNGNAQVDSNLQVNQNATVNGNLVVNGKGTIKQGLSVSGQVGIPPGTAVGQSFGSLPTINANADNHTGGGVMVGGDGGFFDYSDGYITYNGSIGLRVAGNNGAGSNGFLDVQGTAYVTGNAEATALSIGMGNTAPIAPIDVGPIGPAGGYIALRQTGCSQVPYSALVNNGYANCPGGTYATMAYGVYSNYFMAGNIAPSGWGEMFCCSYASNVPFP